MEILDTVIQALTKDCKTQEDFTELFRTLKQRGLEAALAGELTDHLGYDKHSRGTKRKPNNRNGYSKKTMSTAHGKFDIRVFCE